MFAKIIVVILGLGITASGVLVLRQQRLEAAFEMTQTHKQILQHERLLWHMRTELAVQRDPSRIRTLMESLDVEWQPIPEPPQDDHAPETPFFDGPSVEAPGNLLVEWNVDAAPESSPTPTDVGG